LLKTESISIILCAQYPDEISHQTIICPTLGLYMKNMTHYLKHFCLKVTSSSLC